MFCFDTDPIHLENNYLQALERVLLINITNSWTSIFQTKGTIRKTNANGQY